VEKNYLSVLGDRDTVLHSRDYPDVRIPILRLREKLGENFTHLGQHVNIIF